MLGLHKQLRAEAEQERPMADKPSRALVLYGDGLARFLDPSHTHLHSFSSLSCCGFLTLPHPPPSENEDARIIREFAQLLDSHEFDTIGNSTDLAESQSRKDSSIAPMSERFMGMKAAVVTCNPSLDLGRRLGLTTLLLNELSDNSHLLDDSALIASELLKLLGFLEGKTLEQNQFDILFVHIGACELPNGLVDINHLNGLVGALINVAKPGTEISYRLHLSVLMSYGAVYGNETSDLSLLDAKHDSKPELSLLFPRQSYTVKGGKQRDNVRSQCPILVAQWQNAVTRKDMAEAFSFAEFMERGGNLVIPADRFIHEVAFKLWKAPKYGA